MGYPAGANVAELFCHTLGKGRPMLLMHGGLGLDHTCFRPWLDPIAGEDTQLVFYDHRGNGRSAPPVDWSGVTHDTWVNDADALRESLGHHKLVVFGHSYGGFLALEYALQHPDRVAGLILCGTAATFSHFPAALARVTAHATPGQIGVFDRMLTPFDDASLREAWMTILPLYFHRYDPSVGAALMRNMTIRAAAFNHVAAGPMLSFDVQARLTEIGVPTLILVGRHDWIMPPDLTAQKLCEGIAGSEMVIFEQSGHWPFIEEQRAFIDVVRAWMAHT